MHKPVPLYVPFCSTNVPSNVPAMEQAEHQRYQGIEALFKTRVPFVPCFYTPLLVLCVFYSVLVMCRRFSDLNSGGKNHGTNGTEFKKCFSKPYIPRLTACSKKGTKNGTTMEHCSIETGTTDRTIWNTHPLVFLTVPKSVPFCSAVFHLQRNTQKADVTTATALFLMAVPFVP